MTPPKVEISPEDMRRDKPSIEEVVEKDTPSVSLGAIDRMVDLIFNASPEKLREVSNIDRIQGKLLPQLDILDVSWQHCIEIAAFRQDVDEYAKVYGRKRPTPPDLIGLFTYRTLQYQKSVGGVNLRAGMDLALAETENKAMEGEEGIGADAWKD